MPSQSHISNLPSCLFSFLLPDFFLRPTRDVILFCLFRSLKKREAYLKEKKILTSWWIKLLQSLQGNEWLRVKCIDVIYLKGIQLGYIEQKITYNTWLNMAEKIWMSRMLLPPTFIYLRLISKQLNSRKMSFFYTCNCLCKIFFITISW